MSFNNIYAETTKINEVEGKVVFQDYIGNLDIDTISSNIDIHYKEFNNWVKINCISSKIKFDFPKGSDYLISQSVINTDIRYYLNDSSETTQKPSGKNKIKIEGIENSISICEYEKG